MDFFWPFGSPSKSANGAGADGSAGEGGAGPGGSAGVDGNTGGGNSAGSDSGAGSDNGAGAGGAAAPAGRDTVAHCVVVACSGVAVGSRCSARLTHLRGRASTRSSGQQEATTIAALPPRGAASSTRSRGEDGALAFPLRGPS